MSDTIKALLTDTPFESVPITAVGLLVAADWLQGEGNRPKAADLLRAEAEKLSNPPRPERDFRAEENERWEQTARSAYDSILAMVTAVRVDYDRLEELRGIAADNNWVANRNMPGYMPDDMDPATFSDADDAIEYLKERAEEYVDDQVTAGEITEEEADELTDQIKEWKADRSGEFGQYLGNYFWFVSRTADALTEDERAELRQLEDDADGCVSLDHARQMIEEDALSIEVRSGWVDFGQWQDSTPEQFQIAITLGGPTIYLRGELDADNMPDRAWLEVSDGGGLRSWHRGDMDVLLEYARVFPFEVIDRHR